MKAILFLALLALSLLIVQTKEPLQRNGLASKIAQFHNNLTLARPWPIHGGHGPVITNFTKNLTHHKMADDELWSFPDVRKNRPAVTNFTRNLLSAAPRPKIAIKPAVQTAKLTQDLTNIKNADDELWAWPEVRKNRFNLTQNLTNVKKADDEFWSWPKFGGHGPVVNFTQTLVNNAKDDDELWSWPNITEQVSAVTNFTKNSIAKKSSTVQTDDELWSWPKFGGHGPVVTNFTRGLMKLTVADDESNDELWSWPKFGGHGPVVIKNKTEVYSPKNKTQGKFLGF